MGVVAVDRVVARCLAEHPHDTTVRMIATRLGYQDRSSIEAAVELLRQDGLVHVAGEHVGLTPAGWRSVRGQ